MTDPRIEGLTTDGELTTDEKWDAAVPMIGVLGTVTFFPILLWHLYSSQRRVFYFVVAITVAVVAVELLYFEREA